MTALGSQLVSLLGVTTYLVSLGIYGYMIFIILKHLAPKLIMANKVTLNSLVGPALAFIVVLLAIEHAPVMIAESINRGYDRSMPILLETSGKIADGLTYFGTGGDYDAAGSTLFTSSTTELPGGSPSTGSPPQPVSTPVNSQPLRHTVQQGETLETISAKYNRHWESFMEVNNLRDTTIYVGQELIIPERPMILPTPTPFNFNSFDPSVDPPPQPK